MIIYEGPSLLDGRQITVVATGIDNKSTNLKTGEMVQTWILLTHVDPRDAVRSGADYSICGGCCHRSQSPDYDMKERSCYVNVGQAPLVVWRTIQSAKYRFVENLEALGEGRVVRLGSYGDPAAVPRHVWERLTARAEAVVGYTHQWRLGFALADLCMASCDTPAGVADAEAMGYRAFHVTPTPQPRAKGVMVCPASAEAGHRLSCVDCRSCGGTSSKARAHVQIAAHGPAARLVQLRAS